MNVSGRLPRTPNASSATSTTVWIAIPPSRLPTATPTLPDTRSRHRDGDLGQVGRDAQEDDATERGTEVQPLGQHVGVVRELDPGAPDDTG